ncbi:MAG: GNAT family protein [Elainellaceae cyanobacterium]
MAQRSPNLTLRPTVDADLDFVMAAEGHPDNRPFVGQWSRQEHADACTDPDHRHYILHGDQNAGSNPKSLQANVDPVVTARVGYLMMQGMTDPHLTLQIRRIVVTEKGKGYGRMALRLAKQIAFEKFSTHRLWLDVKTHNPRARHLYESEGFVYEGTLRECCKVGDRFESLAVLSILREEYEKNR